MKFQGLFIFLNVEACIAQLTVDGAQQKQIICSNLESHLEILHTLLALSHFTVALSLKCQIETGSTTVLGVTHFWCMHNGSSLPSTIQGTWCKSQYKIIKITEHITLGSTNNMPQERMQKSCSSDGKHSNRWAPNSVQNTMTFLHASQLKTPYFLGQLRYGCRASNYGQLLPHFTWWYLTSQVFKCAYAHLVSTILQFKKIQNL